MVLFLVYYWYVNINIKSTVTDRMVKGERYNALKCCVSINGGLQSSNYTQFILYYPFALDPNGMNKNSRISMCLSFIRNEIRLRHTKMYEVDGVLVLAAEK